MSSPKYSHPLLDIIHAAVQTQVNFVVANINLYGYENFQSAKFDLNEVRVDIEEGPCSCVGFEYAFQFLPRTGRARVAAWGIHQRNLTLFDLDIREHQLVAINGKPVELPADRQSWFAPPIKPEVESFITAKVEELLQAIQDQTDFEWDGLGEPKVVIDWNPDTKWSRGSASRIKIAVANWIFEESVHFPEYPSFRSDPTIGAITGTWQTAISVLVAHELAHWAQCSDHVKKSKPLNYRAPHGDGYKHIYRQLRRIALASEQKIIPCKLGM